MSAAAFIRTLNCFFFFVALFILGGSVSDLGPLWSVKSMQGWLTQGFNTWGIFHSHTASLFALSSGDTVPMGAASSLFYLVATQSSSWMLCRLPSCALRL